MLFAMAPAPNLKIMKLSETFYHLRYKLSHNRRSLHCCHLHFLMGGNLSDVFATEVGYHAQAEYFHAGVVGYYHLRNCAHANCIAADDAEILILCRGLKRRTCGAYIYSAHKAYVLLVGYVACKLNQLGSVCMSHGRETGA